QLDEVKQSGLPVSLCHNFQSSVENCSGTRLRQALVRATGTTRRTPRGALRRASGCPLNLINKKRNDRGSAEEEQAALSHFGLAGGLRVRDMATASDGCPLLLALCRREQFCGVDLECLRDPVDALDGRIGLLELNRADQRLRHAGPHGELRLLH